MNSNWCCLSQRLSLLKLAKTSVNIKISAKGLFNITSQIKLITMYISKIKQTKMGVHCSKEMHGCHTQLWPLAPVRSISAKCDQRRQSSVSVSVQTRGSSVRHWRRSSLMSTPAGHAGLDNRLLFELVFVVADQKSTLIALWGVTEQ